MITHSDRAALRDWLADQGVYGMTDDLLDALLSLFRGLYQPTTRSTP